MTENLDSETDHHGGEFPRPGSMYHSMLFIEKSKKRYLRSFKIFNFFMTPLYKLRVIPLFGIGRRLLILTTIGRNSGKKRIAA